MKKTVFKKIFYLGVLVLFAMSAGQALAQDVPTYDAVAAQRPAPSAPYYIAMVFSRLTGQPPDFDGWARSTKAYQEASEFDRMTIADRQVQEFKSTYNLLTLQEPVVVEMPVDLSAYSAENGGFFVRNFTDKTFFPVRYSGQAYAIVPQGLVDKQWIKISEADARTVDAAAGRDRQLTMTLFLVPKYADKSAPVTIGDADYWLISAEVKKIMLYAKDSGALLWQSEDTAAEDAHHQELLNLRQ